MSAQVEMRNVIEHAAAKLQRVQQRDIGESNYNHGYQLPSDAAMAMSYARGVLDLLATYLKIDEAPAGNGHQPNGEMSRDAKILAAAQAGEKLTEIAHRFGISESRVRQIRDTAQQQAAG
jgi:Sigma-70, region 4